MSVFYVLLLVPLLIQHIAIKGRRLNYEKKNKLAISFFFFLLTVLVMLRHESVGNDTRNYMHFFVRFSLMDWDAILKSGSETGFAVLNKLVSLFSREPQFFIAVSAIAVSAMIYPTYKRLSVDATLTIVLFCVMSTFAMMFSGIRQMLAVGLGFIGYEQIRKRNLISFVCIVLLAMTIHTSAFMLLFMYPLYYAKITKNWLYFVIPGLAVAFLFNRQIFSVLTGILERFTKYQGTVSTTGAYTILILFVVFSAFSFIIPDELKLDEETNGLRNFLLMSLVIQMFAPLHLLAMRMNYYYIIFIPLLLPKIIRARSKRWNQVALLARHVMVAFFVFYFFYNAYLGGALNVFPYHFFWENV